MKRFLTIAVLLLCTTLTFAQAGAIMLGHRGGRNEQDENTLAAFRNAWAAGIHSFETDMRLSKDGAVIIAHDTSLLRTCGIDKTVERLTAKELRKIKTKQGNPLLFLDDLLDFFKDKKGLYVEFEMKTEETNLYPDDAIATYCDKVYAMIKAKIPADANWSLTSFDERALAYQHAHHPDAVLQLITGKPCSAPVISQAKKLGVQRIACWLNSSNRRDVKLAHDNGIQVNLWPGSKLEDTLLALYMGADFLCTDVPIAMKKYFEEHPPYFPVRF